MLAAVELALFSILMVPTLINLITFVKHGQTGWIFIFVFVLGGCLDP